MSKWSSPTVAQVNRHTGGLENTPQNAHQSLTVNRHTGGLENSELLCTFELQVNRHTGGLERLDTRARRC